MKMGTFALSVNGAQVCADTAAFAYNVYSGVCTGAGISGSFINYATGDYQVTFSSPPAVGAVIQAQWTEIMSRDATGGPEQIDSFGDGHRNLRLVVLGVREVSCWIVGAYLLGLQQRSRLALSVLDRVGRIFANHGLVLRIENRRDDARANRQCAMGRHGLLARPGPVDHGLFVLQHARRADGLRSVVSRRDDALDLHRDRDGRRDEQPDPNAQQQRHGTALGRRDDRLQSLQRGVRRLRGRDDADHSRDANHRHPERDLGRERFDLFADFAERRDRRRQRRIATDDE